MLYSIIDIGSNTVKIAVLDEERIFSSAPVFFKAVPLNLRSKVADNRLSEDATNSLCALLLEFSEISKRLTPTPPLTFATASLRGLDNAGEILKKIQTRCQLNVQIISGETEAYFSFLGAKGSSRAKSGIVVDLGGGSTEILSFQNQSVLSAVSLPFGCLSLYHAFFEAEDRFDSCCRYIRKELDKMAPKIPVNTVLLSGGSAKAVLKYKNILENKRSFSLGRRQFKRIRRHYHMGNTELRFKIEQALKDRYRLIPPALAVFSEILRFYEKDVSFVCRSGVREGCLLAHLQNLQNS